MESILKSKNKKGQAGVVVGLIAAVVAVLVLFIVMSVTGFVNESFANSLPAGSSGAAIADNLTAEIVSAVPLAGILLILSFVVGIIALLFSVIAFRGGGRGGRA